MSRLVRAAAMSAVIAIAVSSSFIQESIAGAGHDAGAELATIMVTARHIDPGRNRIQTWTGASTYTIDSRAIAAAPGGDDSLLNQVLLQAPGVSQDSFGQFHVRGEHNGLQYRINGVVLPEGVSVFGQTLDPRLISSVSLITGALPAEFGLRTAGIVDIETRSGSQMPGGSAALYGGSHGTVQPSFTAAGGHAGSAYFVSGDLLRNDLGIESPDDSSDPAHDRTTQYHGFGYLERSFGEHSRIALMLGTSVGRFQIPDLRGRQPSLGLTVYGRSTYPSEALNENQREVAHFGAAAWKYASGHLDVQGSVVGRYSSLTFVPDPLGDLLYDGIAQWAFKQNVAYAAQFDAAYRSDRGHTLRAGAFLQSDHSASDTASQVLPTDPNGMPLGDVPIAIAGEGTKTQWIQSLYVQDEWRIRQTLTINYGLRFDRFTAYTGGRQTSPRLNLVWQASAATTWHAGYSRYFSPPPFELVGARDVVAFEDTTSPPLSPRATPPKPERANYYDLGIDRKATATIDLGFDTYYKQSRDLVDEGQFGAPIVLTPFNYRYGRQYGAELTANYTTRALEAYLNLAAERALGKGIESSEFNFSPADLAYIARHYIDLDHEQQWTASGGIAYRWKRTRVSGDFLWGSGLRADRNLPPGTTTPYGGTGIPNGAHLPYYVQVNLGVGHEFPVSHVGPLTVRFDVINLFDRRYQIRNGTGIGVGAPQYGARRGLFLGVSTTFGPVR